MTAFELIGDGQFTSAVPNGLCVRAAPLFQVLLSSGLVFWLSVDHGHGDITKITKDTSLIGRLSLDTVCDGKSNA